MQNKIIIIGTGNYGEKAYQSFYETNRIIAFADNNKAKQGKKLHEIEIVSVEKAIEDYVDENTSIVVATAAYHEINRQLNGLDINRFYIMLNDHLYNSHIRKEGQVCRCKRCVMDDSSDNRIIFDDEGYCNYCTETIKTGDSIYFPNEEGERRLNKVLSEIKEYGKDKKYDCIMGLSGGLDSSYLAYLGYKWGLRVLAIHIDDGYDTEISKNNLKKLIEKTKFDYEVIKPDKEQFNDLILAYMKAGVPNIAVPQDNVLFAFLYKKMRENNIEYFLSGGNFALECILQKGNTYSAFEIENIYAIQKRYGTKPIDKLELLSREMMEKDVKELNIKSLRPLNFIEYKRQRAFEQLKEFCGFEYYGRKHLENAFTAFHMLYWLPLKFGVDKRKSHLSSMIVSGQMTREAALHELEEPLCNERKMDEYIELLKKNIGITDEEFDEIMKAQPHQHEEYTK